MVSSADPDKRTGRLAAWTGAFANAVKRRASVAEEPGRASEHAPKASSAPASTTSADAKRNRTWDPEEWEEDQRFVEAMDLVMQARKREALSKLEALYRDDPGHLYGRLQLFHLALDMKAEDVATAHADWAVEYHTQHSTPQNVCDAYREARTTLPHLKWSERALVQALLGGEKAKDKRVVVDATKQLVHHYPASAAMPRALFAGAQVQLDEGRPDLARNTLRNLIARYPLDPLAELAHRKLGELDPPSQT